MKKRLLVVLLAGCMTFGTLFTGCGSIDKVKETIASAEDKEEEEEEKEEGKKLKASKKEEEAEEKEEAEEVKEIEEEVEEESYSDIPSFDSEDAEGYEGFEYLYEDELVSEPEDDEESGKKKKEKVTVFIPDGDYSNVERDYAYAEAMGVEFDIRLNPYIQYEQEDYSARENLQEYLDTEFDEFYTTEYKDLELSEAEELYDDAASATAKYCEYDEYEEGYDVYYKTFYMKELSSGALVLIEVSISANEVTDKAEDLLFELESFYEFDIDWDEEEAAEKLENYLANDTGDSDVFSTGFLKFDLPKGWEKDSANSSYNAVVYAPDGDADFAECGIMILNEYVGAEGASMEMLVEESDILQGMMEEICGEVLDSFEVEYYGETAIGDTALLKFTFVEDDVTAECEFYMSIDDGDMYGVLAMNYGDCEEDIFGIANEIVENGKTK